MRLNSFLYVCGLLCVSSYTHAIEYVSVLSNPAALYDAPSTQAKQLATVSGTMPYESVVTLSDWIKVRDFKGKLFWIPAQKTSHKRYILVTTPSADVFQQPQFIGRLLFRVTQEVVLEWLDTTGTGWVKVRHADGEVGYIRSEDVWGE